jgi:hypothetical protein
MTTRHLYRWHYLAFFALAVLFWIGVPAGSQVSPPQDSDTTQRELAGLDRFMDSHPEIAEQLRKDPSLINNKEFVEHHAALQDYVREHPEVRQELTQNPNAFMRQEDRFDRREENRMNDRDTTVRELASMDRFLDSHPEVAEQLRKKPSLVNNEEFVEKHPALQQYLQDHPGVREEITENPNAFMSQEDRFDRREDNRMNDRVHERDTTDFSGFLGSHSNISQELAKDPSLAKNQEYLQNHPDLQRYLTAHPGVHHQLTENPQVFMKSVEQVSSSGTTKAATTVEAKPKQ